MVCPAMELAILKNTRGDRVCRLRKTLLTQRMSIIISVSILFLQIVSIWALRSMLPLPRQAVANALARELLHLPRLFEPAAGDS